MAKKSSWTLRTSNHLFSFIQRTQETQRLIQLIIDADGGGTIGLEELENPLIGLGFAENREDVQELIKTIDEDDNGDIDFGEF